MQVVLVVLIALLAAVLVLLASPLTLTVDIERGERWAAHWRAQWLWGLVGMRFIARVPRWWREQRKKRRHRAKLGGSLGLAAIRTPGLIPRAGRLLADLARCIRCEKLTVWVEYGFDDPADTAQVYGALVPALLATRAAGWTIQCEPRFRECCLRGAGSVHLRVTPLAVLATLVGFLFSPPVLRAAWAVARA